MGDAAAAAIQPTLYVILNCLFRIMLELFVLAFVVDVIGLSPIDVICSSTLLICMISFTTVCIIMLYQFIIRIKSYGLLLIFSTDVASGWSGRCQKKDGEHEAKKEDADRLVPLHCARYCVCAGHWTRYRCA